MSIKNLLISFLLFPLHLLGQHVKVVTTYPKTGAIKEIYYVLKSNEQIKDGEYFLFYDGQLTKKDLKMRNEANFTGLKEKGFFKNNLKDSLWEFYEPPRKFGTSISSNAIAEEGKFKQGVKIGVWNTYLDQRRAIKRFDFDENQQLEPIVMLSLIYPSEARRKGVEGDVVIKITFQNCEPVKYEIEKDIGYGCGESVIKALKSLKDLIKKYGIKINDVDCNGIELKTVSFKLAE